VGGRGSPAEEQRDFHLGKGRQVSLPSSRLSLPLQQSFAVARLCILRVCQILAHPLVHFGLLLSRRGELQNPQLNGPVAGESMEDKEPNNSDLEFETPKSTFPLAGTKRVQAIIHDARKHRIHSKMASKTLVLTNAPQKQTILQSYRATTL
jgi:hypothetical protein